MVSSIVRARCAALLALIFACAAPNAAVITLQFGPTDQVAFVGDVVSVDILVDALPPAVSIGSFDFFVSYASAIVGAAFVEFGPFLGDPNSSDVIAGFDTSTPDEVELFENSFLAAGDLSALQDPVRGSGFRLATITFIAGAPGISPLGISFAVAADADGIALDTQGASGSIEVLARALPEPASLQLAGLAILCCALRSAALRSTRAPRARTTG